MSQNFLAFPLSAEHPHSIFLTLGWPSIQVVKKAGIIINPIQFKEVNPYEREEEHGHGPKKQKAKKGKGSTGGKGNRGKKANNSKR